MKKYRTIDYRNKILHQDQEQHPFEITFDYRSIKDMVGTEFDLSYAHPSVLGSVALPSFFNYKNGGLVTYVFAKN